MKTPPSALAPFVRSDAQGDVLAHVLLHPDREFSIADVQRATGTAAAVAHREVTRLLDAGVLTDRTVGRSRMVRVNPDYPLLRPLTELVTATYGPVPVLKDVLRGIDGVREAYIFGSWAARRAGEAGPTPRDVDVLVVGSAPRAALADAARAAEQWLSREVNISRVSAAEWDEGTAPFVRTVRSRPLTAVVPEEV
ncbi:nucleotidyltransferase domain-containing protein [Cellulomonas fimi]|uniref:nucleotidyltransferase domain-containing protein n=1 Tax=Cellulomonas fimi TaxID=1708 RepID=UPI001B860389|nr:nucleotidyltransferase domain-containing protein [Cellulomonas fimi]